MTSVPTSRSEQGESDARTSAGAVIMDGNRLRDEIVAEIARTIESAGSPRICLATVLVGDDGPSQRCVLVAHVPLTRS
ncbi:MAG: hypothetical protein ACKOI2_09065, partial [Actinomycetota bacterium]